MDPSWFYPGLLALVMPHIGRARTIQIWEDSCWKQLSVILNNAANINNLSLITGHSPPNPTPPLNVLRNLKELSLSLIVYDESFHEIMEQVEKLDLAVVNTDLWKWLGSFVQLKWLHIRDINYTGLTDPNFLVRLESLAYLGVSMRLYHSIAPRLSLPRLRHLHLHPRSAIHLEPQDCRHHPLLRTLCIVLDLDHIQLLPVIMNPQLEFLEIKWRICDYRLLTLLSELLDPIQGLTLPSGATFPGLSLKYFRLIYTGARYDANYEVPLSTRLVSILMKSPHLKMDVVVQRVSPGFGFEGLKKQFPSRVKCYQRVNSVPLDELYERSRKDSE